MNQDSQTLSWTLDKAQKIYSLTFPDLLFRAQTVHREHFSPNEIQVSTLLSIKTGSCPENCAYCPQSSHYKTDLKSQPLMEVAQVVTSAKKAKAMGSTRFCLGAAWRSPRDRDLEMVSQMVKEVKALGMETCVTLGMLKEHQIEQLKASGLDYYNHNIDSSEEFYGKVISTREYQDRLETLALVQKHQVKVCCGGILGMGETEEDRLAMLVTLANMSPQPQSVPINKLIKIPGTPLADQPDIDPFEFVRTVALARIMLPKSHIRLSAGREHMSEELQTLCFLAGANSIFFGEKLLTAPNPIPEKDMALMEKLGIKAST